MSALIWLIAVLVVLILLIIALSWAKVITWSNPFKKGGEETPEPSVPKKEGFRTIHQSYRGF